MSEKLIYRFEYSWQAQLFADILDKEGIQYSLVPVPREYTSIIAGSYVDPMDILVSEADFSIAMQLLAKFKEAEVKQNAESAESAEDSAARNINYFSRTIWFSLMGISMFPIVFNFAATSNFFKLKDQVGSQSKKIFALAVLLACWLIAVGEVYFLWRHFKVTNAPIVAQSYNVAISQADAQRKEQLVEELTNCLESKDLKLPGNAFSAAQDRPNNGIWELDSIECKGGELSTNGLAFNGDMKSKSYVGRTRISGHNVYKKFQQKDANGRVCQVCARTELSNQTDAIVVEKFIYVHSSWSDGKQCSSISPPESQNISYERDGHILRITSQSLTEERNSLCKSGQLVKKYYSVKEN